MAGAGSITDTWLRRPSAPARPASEPARSASQWAQPCCCTRLAGELEGGGPVVDAAGALKHLHHGAVAVHLQHLER